MVRTSGRCGVAMDGYSATFQSTACNSVQTHVQQLKTTSAKMEGQIQKPRLVTMDLIVRIVALVIPRQVQRVKRKKTNMASHAETTYLPDIPA